MLKQKTLRGSFSLNGKGLHTLIQRGPWGKTAHQKRLRPEKIHAKHQKSCSVLDFFIYYF